MKIESARDVLAADIDLILASAGDEFQALAGRRVVLTGGAGFLGYSFVMAIDAFNERNPGRPIDLHVLDSFMRGYPPWLKQLEGRPSLHIRQYDVRVPGGLPPADYIIHGASIASPTFYRLHPIETMDANVLGLRNVLDQCVAAARDGTPVRGVLFFSSSEIYGDPPADKIPTREDFPGLVSCTGPRACYDESKRYGETLCVNFAAVHGVPVKVARPFNNYGPGLKISDKRVIPDFCRAILAGEDITILSTGAPTRTFSYVADAIAGYIKILVRGQPGEAYNIGTDGPEVTVVQLAQMLAEAARARLGYAGKVQFATSADPHYLTDNPQRRCPDLAKARSQLGYEPQVTLSDGLTRALLWYADNQHWGDEQ